MAETIQRYTQQFLDGGGAAYTVVAGGEATEGGTWEGWLEFHPLDGTKPALRTGRETTQPDRPRSNTGLRGWSHSISRARSPARNKSVGATAGDGRGGRT